MSEKESSHVSISLHFSVFSMSSCPPSCALRIFQAAKESESSLLFTANLHPAEVWFLMLMCSNTLLHLLYSNATVALCAALCHLLVNPLLLHQLPWGCSACNNTATEAKTDGVWRTHCKPGENHFPTLLNLRRMVLKLFCFLGRVSVPCSPSLQCKVMGK